MLNAFSAWIKASASAGFLHLEGVEARPCHEQELIAEHVAGRPDFALEAVALAQAPCLAVSAPVAEDREFKRDQRKLRQMGRKLAYAPVVRPGHAQRRAALCYCVWRGGEKPVRRHNRGHIRWHGPVALDIDPWIGGNRAVFNVAHRAPP